MNSTRWATVLAATIAASLTVACGKSASEVSDTSGESAAAPAEREPAPSAVAPEGEGAPDGEADAPEGADQGDLEDAIAGARAKGGTVTAVGESGKTVAHALGHKQLTDTDTYTVSAEVPASVSAGKEVAVKLHVTPKPGWKLNQEFPTKLSVEPPPGVTLSKPVQKAADAAKFGEKAAAFVVGFQAASAGKKSFVGELRFAVCTETTCDPKTAKLAWAVDVE